MQPNADPTMQDGQAASGLAPLVLGGDVRGRLDALGEQARDYLADSHAANTRRAYRADWRAYTAWCAAHELEPLPSAPATLTLYLAAQAGQLRTSTLGRRLVAIGQAHRAAGHVPPTEDAGVRAVWRGIRRRQGTAQVGKAAALTADVRAMVLALPDGTASAVRDRAMLLLGFAAALRRSELVALDVVDVQPTAEGLVLTIRRSKTDQEGSGEQVGVPHGSSAETCPVRALLAWLERAGIAEGPIFRSITRHGAVLPRRLSDRDVARIVKRAVERAGLDPTRYAGHSLRAGLATAAAIAGAEERDIMRQTRHKSVAVVRRYIRDGSLFRANAAATVGL